MYYSYGLQTVSKKLSLSSADLTNLLKQKNVFVENKPDTQLTDEAIEALTTHYISKVKEHYKKFKSGKLSQRSTYTDLYAFFSFFYSNEDALLIPGGHTPPDLVAEKENDIEPLLLVGKSSNSTDDTVDQLDSERLRVFFLNYLSGNYAISCCSPVVLEGELVQLSALEYLGRELFKFTVYVDRVISVIKAYTHSILPPRLFYIYSDEEDSNRTAYLPLSFSIISINGKACYSSNILTRFPYDKKRNIYMRD